MQRSRLYLLVIVGLFLSGCQPKASGTQEPNQAIPTATEIKIINTKCVTETVCPRVTLSITLNSPEAEPPQYNLINCDETVCQVEWTGILDRPITEGNRNTIALAYPYASTRDGTLPPHHGVEFPNPSGTPVLAAAPGNVEYAGSDDLKLLGPYTGFYGNVVILKHEGLFEERDVFTLYAHLSAIDVEVGETVKSGDKLGEVGASGAADGSHLHFEVRLDENAYAQTINPILWFTPVSMPDNERASMLAGSIVKRNGDLISEFELSLEKYGLDGSIEERHYLKTYVSYDMNAHPIFNENFALTDIPAGDYRLAFVYGSLYEYFFHLEPGSLGYMVIQLD
ncbi:MAG: M23 family metallopeptidase [Chloroflexota bacterium]|nr:M23 family metallopeptidase [Chloroflexota bacterium]